MAGGWVEEACGALLRARGPGGAWGYRPGLSPAVEPTALAGLALRAHAPGPVAPAEAVAAAGWLAAMQRPDGSLGVSAALPRPGWPTPYALLLWGAVGGFEGPARLATSWLLQQRGEVEPKESGAISAHDPSLDGWPWLPGTHPWVEPTAAALLALRDRVPSSHPRVIDGLRLLRDRALDSGGWNYGNTVVFGHELRPHPAPTGLALLALALAGERTSAVDRAARYLRDTLPGVRSGPSLGWGLLGLDAWNLLPEEAEGWLAEAAAKAMSRPDPAPNLAPLLLAAAGRTRAIFGIDPLP